MVSLWGTKNSRQDDQESQDTAIDSQDQGNHASTRRTVVTRNVDDERAPLLARPAQGYLSPDDPAVTPLNLWSVRILRFFLVIFLAVTFVWWVLMLVSIFVTPPGMHTRGSGFTDFSYTTLALFNILIALLFFEVPSKALQISNIAVALLLLIDMIIIVSVTRLREEESWPGIASVVWALLMSIYVVAVDRVVAWGKKEEEERLTGREETRRTLKEWLAVVAETFAMTIVLAVVILLTATLILRARDASLEAPGKKYWVYNEQYQVHLYCKGPEDYAGPTVLIEAGEDPVEWNLGPFVDELYRNGTVPRYCLWDRPGMAFSDNAPSPLSAAMISDALGEALAQAGEDGPWIIVGAGIGGIYARMFSSQNRGNVDGLVLIDAMHEDLLWRIASAGRGFKLWGQGIISPLGIDRLIGAIFKGRTREDRVWGVSSYQGGRRIKAVLQENLAVNRFTKAEIRQARLSQDPTVPLVIISSGIKSRSDSEWYDKQNDLEKLTDNLVAHDTVRKAPHAVWQSEEGRKAIKQRLSGLID